MKFDKGQQMVGKSAPLSSVEPPMVRIKGLSDCLRTKNWQSPKRKSSLAF